MADVIDDRSQDTKGKKKGKKKKGPKINEEEERAKREEAKRLEVAEKLRIEKEKEAEAKAHADKIVVAKRAILDAVEREKIIILPDDIVPPHKMWTTFEVTKQAIYYAKQAGVDLHCDEFKKLRARADQEKAILGRWNHEKHLESLALQLVPGSHNGPRLKGDLSEDERILVELWEENGGKDGLWRRTNGWEHVGKWVELCEAWQPPERVIRPVLKKNETLPITIDEIVKKAVPSAEGIVVHRSRVQNISLFANNLNSSIPSGIGLLNHLKILNLHGNSLTGPIPTSLTRCEVLQHLDLCKNSLTGPLPEGFGNFSQLKYLHLENNLLTGPLPTSLSKMTYLKEFTAHRNKFKGKIPVDIGECRELKLISLHHNRLTGFLPDSLSQCVKLEQLLLVKNKLIGDSVPQCYYTNLSITSTPRSGLLLKCQVFPSKSPDSDSETESIVNKKQTEDNGDEYYEQEYTDNGYDNYIGYAGEYQENEDYQEEAGEDMQDTNYDNYGVGELNEEYGELAISEEYYNEPVEAQESNGYYDEMGNWVEGYYDEEGNWVETQGEWGDTY